MCFSLSFSRIVAAAAATKCAAAAALIRNSRHRLFPFVVCYLTHALFAPSPPPCSEQTKNDLSQLKSIVSIVSPSRLLLTLLLCFWLAATASDRADPPTAHPSFCTEIRSHHVHTAILLFFYYSFSVISYRCRLIVISTYQTVAIALQQCLYRMASSYVSESFSGASVGFTYLNLARALDSSRYRQSVCGLVCCRLAPPLLFP